MTTGRINQVAIGTLRCQCATRPALDRATLHDSRYPPERDLDPTKTSRTNRRSVQAKHQAAAQTNGRSYWPTSVPITREQRNYGSRRLRNASTSPTAKLIPHRAPNKPTHSGRNGATNNAQRLTHEGARQPPSSSRTGRVGAATARTHTGAPNVKFA